jgi:hypothetical protein
MLDHQPSCGELCKKEDAVTLCTLDTRKPQLNMDYSINLLNVYYAYMCNIAGYVDRSLKARF